MEALLTAIVLWLSSNFDIPASFQHPQVEFASAEEIAALRYQGFTGGQIKDISTPGQPGATEIISIYNATQRTIYLPPDWKGGTPAELSVLVHEMVHHLQNAGQLKFECPQQREELAYRAQEKWLAMFGRSLMLDFELDPFSVLMKSKCM